MYGFGGEEEGIEPQSQDQGPKWFRDHMAKVSEDLKALRARNEQLEQAQRRQAVKESLTAKGYAPQVADLYTGKPEDVETWLGTYGAALARTETAPQGGGSEPGSGAPQTPQTVVTPESQAAMARMAAAGQGGEGGLSADDQLAARINAAETPEELDAIFRESGSKYFR